MILKRLAIHFALIVSVSAIDLAAQETQFPMPKKEHVWLQQFAGEWDSTSKSVATADHPAMQFSGKFESRMVGGFWVLNEMTADTGDVQFIGIQTIGYDEEKKKYVGTWIDSMMNHMWKYEGTLDDSGKKLSLLAEGPNMLKPGTTATYRDSYEFKSKDHIIATSEMKNEDGEWLTFMTGDLKRRVRDSQ